MKKPYVSRGQPASEYYFPSGQSFYSNLGASYGYGSGIGHGHTYGYSGSTVGTPIGQEGSSNSSRITVRPSFRLCKRRGLNAKTLCK